MNTQGLDASVLFPSYILALGALAFRCDGTVSALQALEDAVDTLGGGDLEYSDCDAGCELAAAEHESPVRRTRRRMPRHHAARWRRG
jgi:hypothetical protein